MVMFTRSGGLWPPPQSIDIIPQNLLLLRVFSHGSHSSCCVYSPTDFTDLHRTSCCVYSPTDFTEFTELLAEIVLPQISQICTELLVECILPQISQNSQNFLQRLFSHRFHRSTQIVWVPSRGCTCLKCTNRAMLIYLLLRWCTSCSGKRQSRAETSAPPKIASVPSVGVTLLLRCVKTRKRHAPKGQKHIAQGSALGKRNPHAPYAL